MKNVGGRPTLFTDEIADKICAMVMAGTPMVRICQEDWAPHPTTIYRWFREHDKFCYNYARAKEDQADYFVEDIVQIADLATPEDVQVARLRVDTRKWAASKYKPKKYGDKLLTENQHLDKDGNPVDPPKMVIEVVKVQ